MKSVFVAALFCGFVGSIAQAQTSSSQCSKNSDCEVGCDKKSFAANCYLKTGDHLKVTPANPKCKAPIGGLTCGCKEHKCEYMLPQ